MVKNSSLSYKMQITFVELRFYLICVWFKTVEEKDGDKLQFKIKFEENLFAFVILFYFTKTNDLATDLLLLYSQE